MDSVVHFELPADNTDRAKKFYKESFGWEFKDIPEMRYVLAFSVQTNGEGKITPAGAINGGILRRDELDNIVTAPSFSISVADIDEAIKKVKNAGGLVLRNKAQAGNGFVAYFKDTEGNILSLWQEQGL